MIDKYFKPASLNEALTILDDFKGKARVIAGGTDLILQMKQKKIATDAVVDISHLEQLKYIQEDRKKIKIGALSTHADLAESPTLKKKASFLSDAAQSIGSLQIRNVGTIGGNIVNAQPAADTAVALLALDASVKVVSSSGERQIPLIDLYLSQGGTSLDPCREILTEIIFSPLENNRAAGAFERMARRKAVALPIFNTAVTIWSENNEKIISDVRIVMAPVARIPFRAKEAENILMENNMGRDIFLQAAILAANEAKPRDSQLRGDAISRKRLAQVMVLRALTSAWNIIENMGAK